MIRVIFYGFMMLFGAIMSIGSILQHDSFTRILWLLFALGSGMVMARYADKETGDK